MKFLITARHLEYLEYILFGIAWADYRLVYGQLPSFWPCRRRQRRAVNRCMPSARPPLAAHLSPDCIVISFDNIHTSAAAAAAVELPYNYGSLTCFDFFSASQRRSTSTSTAEQTGNWQLENWATVDCQLDAERLGAGNWRPHLNVVYHNLINNSHSIINQSKLHHFHLFHLLFVVSPTQARFGLLRLQIFSCRLIYGAHSELPRLSLMKAYIESKSI